MKPVLYPGSDATQLTVILRSHFPHCELWIALFPSKVKC